MANTYQLAIVIVEGVGTILVRIALAGLGRVGSRFLEALLEVSPHDVEIRGVAQPGETPEKALAAGHGLRVVDDALELLDDPELDILFDFTGSEKVRRDLRSELVNRSNRRTVIAPESFAHLIWNVLSQQDSLPEVHDHHGY